MKQTLNAKEVLQVSQNLYLFLISLDSDSDKEEEIASSGAIKSKMKKAALEDISLSQWISANANILIALIERKSISLLEEV